MRTWADGGDAAAGCGWRPGPQAPPVERVADPTLWCSLVVGISESPEEGRCQGSLGLAWVSGVANSLWFPFLV